MVLADTKDAVWVTEVEQLKSSNERVFYDVMYLIALAGFVDLVQTGFWDPRIRLGLCGMSVTNGHNAGRLDAVPAWRSQDCTSCFR